ncbi:putative mfs monosaccharide transporter protein [Chaetomidium leptoderma]|uniref:Mfs monosaccharide transporter protein n=1 Tax=Chaetomidium leptoderma TaxID=669021 RepID=A0AAN6ZXI6_9PEZI|nr:putative mfs monosaccharide transporter protein [Chaetomidium leptoderma]
MAGIGNPFENSCILISVGVVAILINSALITHFGRRRVFLVSGLILCGIAQLLTAIVDQVNPGAKSTGQAIVALAVVYILGYNLSHLKAWWRRTPGSRAVNCPRSACGRTSTFGFATAVGFFTAWLTTFTALYFINPESLNWGPKYSYIWAPSCWISALWVFFFPPEVKDRTLEKIDEMFEARIPARRFRKDAATAPGEDEKEDAEVMHSEVMHNEVGRR